MKILSKVPELPTDREKSVTSDEMPVGDFLIEGHSAYEEDGQIKNVIHLREKNGEKVFQVFGEKVEDEIAEHGGIDQLLPFFYKVKMWADMKLMHLSVSRAKKSEPKWQHVPILPTNPWEWRSFKFFPDGKYRIVEVSFVYWKGKEKKVLRINDSYALDSSSQMACEDAEKAIEQLKEFGFLCGEFYAEKKTLSDGKEVVSLVAGEVPTREKALGKEVPFPWENEQS